MPENYTAQGYKEDRNIAITEEVLCGSTLSIVGRKWGICPQRVKGIVARGCEIANPCAYRELRPARGPAYLYLLQENKERFLPLRQNENENENDIWPTLATIREFLKITRRKMRDR